MRFANNPPPHFSGYANGVMSFSQGLADEGGPTLGLKIKISPTPTVLRLPSALFQNSGNSDKMGVS